MNQQQIKDFIAQKVPEGLSLSKIQDSLKEQGVHITFMELRLLASEIEEKVWKQNEKDETPAGPAEQAAAAGPAEEPEENEPADPSGEMVPPPPAPAEAAPQDAPAASRGKTVVELSKIARPGAAASGSVRFGSGVTAEWLIDQFGLLSLDNPSGKPDQQDIREFQIELQKLFS